MAGAQKYVRPRPPNFQGVMGGPLHLFEERPKVLAPFARSQQAMSLYNSFTSVGTTVIWLGRKNMLGHSLQTFRGSWVDPLHLFEERPKVLASFAKAQQATSLYNSFTSVGTTIIWLGAKIR